MRYFRQYLHEQRTANSLGDVLFFVKLNPTVLHSITEAADSTRYSVEVNFRSTINDVLKNFAKIALGYVSAGMKQNNFNVRHVYTDEPVRILVSSRNWDDGEHIIVVSWNAQQKCFVISKGFYNKDRRTISVQSSERCADDNAAAITKQVFNLMHYLKDIPDRSAQKQPLKAVPLKRGPKG